jgi:hypothetical protein
MSIQSCPTCRRALRSALPPLVAPQAGGVVETSTHKKWIEAENRQTVPLEIPEGLDFDLRKEWINVEAIHDFLRRRAARRGVIKRKGRVIGSVFHIFRGILKRIVRRDGDFGVVHTVAYRKQGHQEGLWQRREHTGLAPFPLIPPSVIETHMKHELENGVPRTEMAKSLFAYGSLVKTVCRQGTDVEDDDAQSCWLRLSRVRAHNLGVPCPAWDDLEPRKAGWYAWVKTFAAHATKRQAKTLLLSLCGGGDPNAWAKKEGVSSFSHDAYIVALTTECGAWVVAFLTERAAFARVEAEANPAIVADLTATPDEPEDIHDSAIVVWNLDFKVMRKTPVRHNFLRRS